MTTIRLQDPVGDHHRDATLVSSHGDLAVVEDPFADGYSVVIPAAGLTVSAHRFTGAAAAAAVAEHLDAAADFSVASDDDGREALYVDADLRATLEQALTDADGVISPREPVYPSGDRTGASYEEGYDERRRAARRRR